MGSWDRVIALSAGGVLGVNARYWLGLWVNRWAGAQFPWATLAINVSGSFAIGFLAVALARWLPHPGVRLLVITGFLGGYTTFSTFEHESATLWERGEPGLALANMAGSVGAGFAAVLLGIGLARAIVIPASERAAREGRPGRVAAVALPRPSRSAGSGPIDLGAGPAPPEAGTFRGEDGPPGEADGRAP